MKPTENLTVDDFKPLVGQNFTLAHHHTLVLKEVDAREAPHSDFRAPFSLIFSGPEELKPAEVLPVHHDAIGEHQLMIHRIMAHPDARFEIVFN